MTTYSSSRDIGDLLDSLKRHIRLLEQYYREAFDNKNEDYYGEIAGKIRLLAIEFRSNKPLLIALMNEFDIQPKMVFDVPPVKPSGKFKSPINGQQYTLTEVMDFHAATLRTVSERLVNVSRRELVSLIAEKYGAAHEDWNHPEVLRVILTSDLIINGRKIFSVELSYIAKCVINTGNAFLEKLNDGLICVVSNKRNLAVNYNDYMAHGELGTHYLNARNLKKAEKHLNKSVDIKCDKVETHWNLACLYSLKNEFDRAMYHLDFIAKNWDAKALGDPYGDDDLKNILSVEIYKEKIDYLLSN